jgi:hypothetical protein
MDSLRARLTWWWREIRVQLMLHRAMRRARRYEGETMPNVKDGLPNIGETVMCEVRWWRYHEVVSTERREGKYLGINGLTGHPLFDFGDYGDDSWPEVVAWDARQQRGQP